jgi:hypothetical protein
MLITLLPVAREMRISAAPAGVLLRCLITARISPRIIDLTLPGWHNFTGCWSSPLTAQRANDSYEEGFLVGVSCQSASIQETSDQLHTT